MKLRLKTCEALAELSMVKVSVERSPKLTELGEKLLLKPGRLLATVNVADEGPLLPALEVRSPVVLVYEPAVELVMST